MMVPPSMFPTWPAKSEMDPKKKRAKSPTPPEGGAFQLQVYTSSPLCNVLWDDYRVLLAVYRLARKVQGQVSVLSFDSFIISPSYLVLLNKT